MPHEELSLIFNSMNAYVTASVIITMLWLNYGFCSASRGIPVAWLVVYI